MSSVEVTSLEKLLSWKLNELKKSCKEYGIPSSGTKAELAERLHMHHVTAAEQAASNELNEAELLGELDDSVEAPAAASEEPVEEEEAAKLVAKAAVKPVKPPKVAAKRKAAPEKKSPAPVTAPSAAASAGPQSDEKTAAVGDLSSAEPAKIEGPENGEAGDAAGKVPVSKMTEEERKMARAKRFGLNSASGPAGGSQPLSLLEKRAARFGEVLAPTLQKSVEAEKLEKRRERFGDISSPKGSSLSEDEKKQKRLERFQDGESASKSSYDEEERKRRRLERFGGSTAPVSAGTGADADKLERRAERFGLQSEEAKKAARAKRFGITA